MENVTFIIKTFERPYCIKRLVKSIYRKYPDAKVLVADDSMHSCKMYMQKHYAGKEIHVYELEPDMGLSYGRNYLIDRVKTDFFVLLDDDFVFDSRTDIESGLNIIEDKKLDILGGYIRNYAMCGGVISWIKLAIQEIAKYSKPANYIGEIMYSPNDGVLYVNYVRKAFPDYTKTDIVLNFFIGKTQVIRDRNRWDDELKLQEHTAFFFKAKMNNLQIGFSNKFSVQHKPMRVKNYGQYRSRNYTQVFMGKYNLKKIVSKYDDGEMVGILNESFQYE